MIYIIAGGLIGFGYAGFKYGKYRKAKQELNEKLNEQIIDTVSFAFNTALFNAIMAGLAFAFVVLPTTTMLLKGAYIFFGGIFIGNLFDMYRLKTVAFTKTAFNVEGISVRYKSISKIYQRGRSKNYVVETNQKHAFVFPKIVIDRIEEYSNKR